MVSTVLAQAQCPSRQLQVQQQQQLDSASLRLLGLLPWS